MAEYRRVRRKDWRATNRSKAEEGGEREDTSPTPYYQCAVALKASVVDARWGHYRIKESGTKIPQKTPKVKN